MPQLSLLPSEPPPRAPQACLTCKKQKRKCDKALPSCTRCASLQRACDYESDTGTTSSTAAAAPTAQDFASLQRKLAQIEARLENLPRTTHVDPSLGMNVDTAMDIDDGGKSMGRGVETATATLPTNRFPSSLFLDIDMYHFAKNIPPRPTVDIPMVCRKRLQVGCAPNIASVRREHGQGHHESSSIFPSCERLSRLEEQEEEAEKYKIAYKLVMCR